MFAIPGYQNVAPMGLVSEGRAFAANTRYISSLRSPAYCILAGALNGGASGGGSPSRGYTPGYQNVAPMGLVSEGRVSGQIRNIFHLYDLPLIVFWPVR